MAKETPDVSRGVDTADDESLYCAACGHRVSERAFRIQMSGAHEHVFVNPAGFQYRIGCFAAAPGCLANGPVESAFSWFPGWAWQVAACAQCRAHLGWSYVLGEQRFHGLILDNLR